MHIVCVVSSIDYHRTFPFVFAKNEFFSQQEQKGRIIQVYHKIEYNTFTFVNPSAFMTIAIHFDFITTVILLVPLNPHIQRLNGIDEPIILHHMT